MGRYRLSSEAELDLYRIWLYGLKKWGIEQADKYQTALFESFEEIANDPFLYQAVDDIRKGYRRSPFGANNIYYRVNGETVEIMAIIGKQDIDNWL